MFYIFASQTERKKLGGSDFLEVQFCQMPLKTKMETVTAVESINFWRDDSLYIRGDDVSAFLKEYGCGIYNNLETGIVDPLGINYYRPELIDAIMEKLLKIRPTDYEKLVEWLGTAKKYNGFYILGE